MEMVSAKQKDWKLDSGKWIFADRTKNAILLIENAKIINYSANLMT